MKKQMKRTVYEALVTEHFQVELEGSLMAASAEVANGDKQNAGINEQDVNTDFTIDFVGDSPAGTGTNKWD